jgi:hypothetical protein
MAALAACVTAAGAYLLRLNDVVGLYVDDAYYVMFAQAIASGDGYRLISAPTPETSALLPASPPGLALVLAIVVALTPAYPANVVFLKMVSVLAMLGAGALAFLFFRDRSAPPGLAIGLALAVAVTPAFVWLATSTVMSEPLFTLALLAAVILALRQRPVPAGAALAVAILIRSAGWPALVGVVACHLVRRQWRPALLVAATAAVVLLPWMVYARAHASPLSERLRHGGAHVLTYREQFWMRRAGDVESGPIAVTDLPARVGHGLIDVFGRDIGAIVLPELYRPPLESGEETLSVGGSRGATTRGSMGNTTGTMLISGLLSAIALVGYAARLRRGPDVTEYVVPLVLVPVILFPHFAFRFVLPLTPFLYGYLVSGIQAMTSSWVPIARVALICVVGLHLLDHASYRASLQDAVWLSDAREVDEVLDWMQRELTRPGHVASTNPALVFLRTGRHAVAIDNPSARWRDWRAMGVRYLVALRGIELPEPSVPYRVVYRTRRSGLWVAELSD